MAAKKDFLGLVHTGGKVRRSPLVGVEFFHQRPVRALDVSAARTRLHAKDLISLLWRHFPGSRRRGTLPRCRVAISVFTPMGFPAVEISGE